MPGQSTGFSAAAVCQKGQQASLLHQGVATYCCCVLMCAGLEGQVGIGDSLPAQGIAWVQFLIVSRLAATVGHICAQG